jgi:hypothetical protein
MCVAYFQELIGTLQWATEIGRVDILLFKVLILSQCQTIPNKGHSERLLHIFAFLCKHQKLKPYLPPELSQMDVGEFRMKREDFTEICRDTYEQLQHRMPTP